MNTATDKSQAPSTAIIGRNKTIMSFNTHERPRFMGYTIHAAFTDDLKSLSKYVNPPVWRVIAPVILTICYAGGIVATFKAEMIPIWIWLHFRNKSPEAAQWPSATLVLLIMTVAMLIGFKFYRLLRSHIISIDALVLLLGSIFAAAYASWHLYAR